MITQMRYMPVEEQSYPFQTAVHRCRLEKRSYIEDEYLMSGTANLYTETGMEHEVKVFYGNAPYTTRLLVRRPAEIKNFSGNVVLEILNSTARVDIDRMWVNTWEYLTQNGDIYVGITSKGHVVESLKRFDAKRYAEVNWNNPLPERQPEAEDSLGFLPQFESGLYWDMQTELAGLLRSQDEKNPLRDYVAFSHPYLYLLGWSQSTGYINRTLASFAYRPENCAAGSLFDGYLAAGGDSSLAPVNSCEIRESNGRMCRAGTAPFQGIARSREPLIAINTESENRGANWGADRDMPQEKFRSYQIAGTSHDAYYNMDCYYEGQLGEDAARAGTPLLYEGTAAPLDVPYHYVFHAALRNLYAWVREGVPAPHAPRIEVTATPEGSFDALMAMQGGPSMKYENRKDLFGNSLGGIRLATQDYPIGRYESYSVRSDGSLQGLYGSVHTFPREQLQLLYGSLAHYKELVRSNAQSNIAEGFLLEQDEEAYVEYCVQLAARGGLR